MALYPTNFFTRPFADLGNYQNIPDAKPNPGRASQQLGFPPETQLPLSEGGIAPNRLDFNGILHMLSVFACWEQTGGQWKYNATLVYNLPAIVFFNNNLWWCVATNGPGTPSGAISPGSNSAYWISLWDYLYSTTIPFEEGPPVGGIIMWPAVTPPDGYFVCNGQSFSSTTYPRLYAVLGVSQVPDMRGNFPRGYDPTGIRDTQAGRQIRSQQTYGNRAGWFNAIIDGGAYPDTSTGERLKDNVSVSDAFYNVASHLAATRKFYALHPEDRPADGGVPLCSAIVSYWANPNDGANNLAETRPYNIALQFCIKHD